MIQISPKAKESLIKKLDGDKVKGFRIEIKGFG